MLRRFHSCPSPRPKPNPATNSTANQVGATVSLLRAVAQASRGAQGLDTFRSRDLP